MPARQAMMKASLLARAAVSRGQREVADTCSLDGALAAGCLVTTMPRRPPLTRLDAYAEQVRRDLSLKMNEAPMPLRLVHSEMRYPTLDCMTGGLGTVALTFEALSPSISSGTLGFANRHRIASASYLVNCWMPGSDEVRVLSQLRSRNQASYEAELAVRTCSELGGAPRTVH
jgi:hypothetical protein